MKTTQFLALLGACSVLASIEARADTSINLTQFQDPNAPDISSAYIGVSYSSGQFLASGYTTAYVNQSVPLLGDSGDWTLQASINSSGFLSGGTLQAWGQVGNGPDPELLLSGNLIAGNAGSSWGYSSQSQAPNLFEFTYHVTGGALASDFLAWGSVGGVILDADFGSGNQAFNGVWGNGFANDGSGYAETFVPEPSFYPFCAFGLLSLLVIFRLYHSGRKGFMIS